MESNFQRPRRTCSHEVSLWINPSAGGERGYRSRWPRLCVPDPRIWVPRPVCAPASRGPPTFHARCEDAHPIPPSIIATVLYSISQLQNQRLFKRNLYMEKGERYLSRASAYRWMHVANLICTDLRVGCRMTNLQKRLCCLV